MKNGIPHIWHQVRDPKKRSIKLNWQCRNCGTYREIRSRAPTCAQLLLPQSVLLTEGRARR